MSAAFIIFCLVWALVIALFAHAAVINLSTAWTWKNVSLTYKGIHDPEARARLEKRKANPPWFERYYHWFEGRLAAMKRGRRP